MITANEKERIEKGRSSCCFDSTWEGDFDGMKEVEEMKKKKKEEERYKPKRYKPDSPTTSWEKNYFSN